MAKEALGTPTEESTETSLFEGEAADMEDQEDTSEETGGEERGDTDEGAPDWKAKYGSPEEMYQALQEAQKGEAQARTYASRTSQLLAELRKAHQSSGNPETEPQRQAAPNQQQPPQGQNPQDMVRAMLRDVVMEVVKPLAGQLKEAQQQSEISRLAAQDKDFESVYPIMAKMLEEDEAGDLWNGDDPKIGLAYRLAKAEYKAQQAEKRASNARNEAYKGKAKKVLNSGTLPGSRGSEMSDGDETPEDALMREINSVTGRGGTIF